jgi:aryl-alcohol dehydrogenase-like predicted oxidoreductase
MKYRKLGNSELNVSIIGLGALHLGALVNEVESLELISNAIDNGINFIDTGPLYGNGFSEKIIGKAIRECRSKIILSTKVGLSRRVLADGSFGVEVLPLRARQIRSSLENSLRELGTDYIDVLQFHAYDSTTPIEESFGEMNRLIDEGKIRAIGVSNYDPNELKYAIEIIKKNSWSPIVMIESHYNMIERMIEKELIPICDNNCISIIPYRSLARGILTGKYENGIIGSNTRAAVSWRVKQWLLPATLDLVSSFSEFAKQSGRTVTELALAWLYSKKNIASVLVGVRDINQIGLCLKSSNWTLELEDLKEIDRLIDLHDQMNHVITHPMIYFEK